MKLFKVVIYILILVSTSHMLRAQEINSNKEKVENALSDYYGDDITSKDSIDQLSLSEDTIIRKRLDTRFEIGINVSPIFQRIVSPTSIFNSNGEYLATFGIKLNQRTMLRSGLNINTVDFKSDDEQGFTNSFTDINARLGVEWRYPIAKWVEMHIGTDITYDISKSKFEFGFGDKSVSDIQGWGIGVPIGATFWITDRFGLWFESSLRAIWSTNESFDEVDGMIFNNQNSNANRVTVDLPASIFAKFAF